MQSAPAVYVVDTSSSARRSTCVMLAASGFEVSCFASEVDFLMHAADLRPGAVLLDLREPGTAGLRTKRAIVRDYPALPVIITTGHGQIDRAVELIKLAARDFIEKPFRHELILKMADRELSELGGDRLPQPALRKRARC